MKTLLATLIVSTMSLTATAGEIDNNEVKKMADDLVKESVVEVTESVNNQITMDIEGTLYVLQMPLNDYAEYVMAKVDSKQSEQDDALFTE